MSEPLRVMWLENETRLLRAQRDYLRHTLIRTDDLLLSAKWLMKARVQFNGMSQ